MHKLLGSVYLSGSVRERGIQRVREILQKGTPHHSPAYAKLCHEVGLPPPAGANGLPHTPPPHKLGRGTASVPYPLTMHGHMPHTASGVQHNGNPISPPFNFPSFGSPISPAPRTAPGGIAANASYMPRQASPFQPMFGRQEEMNGRMPGFREANGYMGGQSGPYGYGPNQPQSARPTYGKHGLIDPARSPNIMPSLSANSQQGNYTDQYLQNVAALQSQCFRARDLLSWRADVFLLITQWQALQVTINITILACRICPRSTGQQHVSILPHLIKMDKLVRHLINHTSSVLVNQNKTASHTIIQRKQSKDCINTLSVKELAYSIQKQFNVHFNDDLSFLNAKKRSNFFSLPYSVLR